ncbi:MAG: hypothetical protein FGM61_03280 [Sediminibacterium sp.]|nr:hypothetical protein [Sediminibacterium sp.]
MCFGKLFYSLLASNFVVAMRSNAQFSVKKALACCLGAALLVSSCSARPEEKATPTYPSKTATEAVAVLPASTDTVPAPDSLHWYVYLTFDDGPQHGTSNCIRVCTTEQAKASFFMVGLHAAKWPAGRSLIDTIRQGQPQFLLANHSYSHARNHYRYFYQHPDSALADFNQAEKILQPNYRIARLPGNNAWSIQHNERSHHLVASVLHKLDSIGYDVIGWDLEWNFRHTNSRPVQIPDTLAARTLQLLREGKTRQPRHLVLLMHDRMFAKPEDAASLQRYLQLLKAEPGMVFETIDHYPGVAKLPPASAHPF